MVNEALARNTGFAADLCADRSRDCITGILLSGIELDDRTASEHGMICRVELLCVVGMQCMGVVGRDHEGTFYGLTECLVASSLGNGNTVQDGCEERASSSLLGL